MALSFYNTISGKKEEFKTLSPRRVKMYCCGVTPYGSTHIGHSRTFFSYDILYRTLIDQGYEVEWARNITDVEDKIITKAAQENTTPAEIVKRYVNEQDEMLEAFNLIRPQHEPKVTESIEHILEIIGTLLKKEMAYVSTSGVYFRTRKSENYGKLSGNKIDDLRSGARIEVDETKEDPLDFALWKFAKPGELKWDSPWGEGRPGWHIECSAMIHSLFGDTIDIHMGGRDLIFPHHECEIAQSEGATGKPFSTFWMHAGMATLNGEKMSKSLNHYVSIGDFLTKYPSEVLRLVFLSVSYTAPLDFTLELADQNLKKLAKIYRFVALVNQYAFDISTSMSTDKKELFEESIFSGLSELTQKMRENICEDLNTSAALASFFEFVKDVNSKLIAMEKKGQYLNDDDRAVLQKNWVQFKKWMSTALGLLGQEPTDFFASLSKYKLSSELSAEAISQKIADRKMARETKQWGKADQIRDELLAQGVQIQDTPHGTKWSVLL